MIAASVSWSDGVEHPCRTLGYTGQGIAVTGVTGCTFGGYRPETIEIEPFAHLLPESAGSARRYNRVLQFNISESYFHSNHQIFKFSNLQRPGVKHRSFFAYALEALFGLYRATHT